MYLIIYGVLCFIFGLVLGRLRFSFKVHRVIQKSMNETKIMFPDIEEFTGNIPELKKEEDPEKQKEILNKIIEYSNKLSYANGKVEGLLELLK